jgi:DUF2997 family protein
MKTIIVTSRRGAVKIETKGFSGPACHKETAALYKDLDLHVESDINTAEFSATTTETEKASAKH